MLLIYSIALFKYAMSTLLTWINDVNSNSHFWNKLDHVSLYNLLLNIGFSQRARDAQMMRSAPSKSKGIEKNRTRCGTHYSARSAVFS